MALSIDAVQQIEDLRRLLLEENGDQVTQFHFWFTDEQVCDLAAGYVPDSLKASFRAALDWHAEDQRRADRPVKATRAKGRGVTPTP